MSRSCAFINLLIVVEIKVLFFLSASKFGFIRSLIVLLLLLAAITQAHAQSAGFDGSAVVTHPMPGDDLSAGDSTIYFNPGSGSIEEWRITFGVAPEATGLYDSGVRLFATDSWEHRFNRLASGGRPVVMRFWQRAVGGKWRIFEMEFNNSNAVAAPAQPVENEISLPSVAIAATANVKAASGEVVQSIKAIHRSGQTFITWTELADGVGYHVYSHNKPITAANISAARKLTNRWGPLDSNTSINTHASGVIPGTYVIEDLQAPLSPQNGLFVHTANATGDAYYAVTAVINNKEKRIFSLGENSLVDSVVEVVALPKPVLTLSMNRGKGRVYTQYMDYANWNPTFNGYAYNYSVALPVGYKSSRSYPLQINPHAYGEALAVKEEAEYGWQVIQLFPSDPGYNQGAVNSWWYGYAADHNYKTDGSEPFAGNIANFTEQRVMMAVDSVISNPDFNVDTSLVYAYGHSMGASGSLSMGIRYGNVIAGIFGSEAMTNYATSPTFQEEFKQLWGSRAANLPIINRGPYSKPLTRYNGIGVWDWMNHHKQLVQRRGDDMAYLMLAQGKADDIIDWRTQSEPLARVFNAASVGYSARLEASAGHGWLGFSGVVHSLFGFGYDAAFPWRYPLNLSYPAIQYASGSGDMRPGITNNDLYNMDIEWATSETRFAKGIVDKPGRYRIALRSMTNDQFADITPRNTQQFVLSPGQQCSWSSVNNNNRAVLNNGIVTADAAALVTIKDVAIKTFKGTTLSIDCR